MRSLLLQKRSHPTGASLINHDLGKDFLQLFQRANIDEWWAVRHRGTDCGIQHPFRQFAGMISHSLDMHKSASTLSHATEHPHAVTM
jgi:hypothetical protein